MEINYPFSSGISLRLRDAAGDGKNYPTTRLCKGLILVHDGQELDEEGVGFGVPVIKRGINTIFSGEMSILAREKEANQEIVAVYRMNLEERLANPGQGIVNSKTLYIAKNTLADLFRRFPALRGLLTAVSNTLRRTFGWETTYQEVGDYGQVQVTYAIDHQAGVISIEVDTSGLSSDGINEVVVMNEQGANWFNQYRDSAGTVLSGDEIESWNEVMAEKASFLCTDRGLAFSLGQVPGARLLRGRELVGSRLAWVGFGYSFHPRLERIAYRLFIDMAA